MIWPFRRKQRNFIPVVTGETWRPGDVAECVSSDDEPWCDTAGKALSGPERGSRAMVLSVMHSGNGAALLKLTGWGSAFFCAAAFRKIVLTDIGADRKVSKRKPVGVEA